MTAEQPEMLVNPLENVLGYQLRRAVLATIAELTERYEALDLRMTEAVILRIVGANPGCNQSAIGRTLGVKRTNMVPIVAELEQRGLLLRTPADGRSNALYLTDAGKELAVRAEEASAANEQEFFGDIPAGLRAQVFDLCRSVRARAND